MQLSFNSAAGQPVCGAGTEAHPQQKLADLPAGASGVIGDINLPEDLAFRLMELGFFPGAHVEAARSAPGGDPRVFRVDGAEIALRRETASSVTLRTRHQQ